MKQLLLMIALALCGTNATHATEIGTEVSNFMDHVANENRNPIEKQLEILRGIIAKGASANTKDERGSTALMYAVYPDLRRTTDRDEYFYFADL